MARKAFQGRDQIIGFIKKTQAAGRAKTRAKFGPDRLAMVSGVEVDPATGTITQTGGSTPGKQLQAQVPQQSAPQIPFGPVRPILPKQPSFRAATATAPQQQAPPTETSSFNALDSASRNKVLELERQGLNRDAAIGSVLSAQRKAAAVQRPVLSPQAPAQAFVPQAPRRDILPTIVQPQAPSPIESAIGKPRSLEEIRRDEVQRAQALIDATEGLFLENLAKIAEQGKRAEAEQSSIAVSAGLAGSPFKQAQVQQIRDKTQEITTAERRRRQAEVAAIMAAAQGRADARFQKERQFAIGERKHAEAQRAEQIASRKAQVEEAQKNARETIGRLARGGFSLDELSSSDLNNLLADSGLSELEARALWAEGAGADVKTSIQNGNVVSYYFDPVTGKPVVSTVPLPIGADPTKNWKSIKIDGRQYLYDADSPTPDKTLVPLGGGGDTGVSEAELKKTEETLDNAVRLLDTIDRAEKKVSAKTTGLFGAIGQHIAGTEANDLQALISTLQSNLAFDRLQRMRDESKTGGALGQVSDNELSLLSSNVASLNLDQTTGQFKENLQRVKELYADIVNKLKEDRDSLLQGGGATDDIDSLLDEVLGKAPSGSPAADTNTGALKVRLPSGETRQGGSASWRNNNPLNIKHGGFAQRFGALPGSKALDGGRFAAFPSEATGLQAARTLLKGESYRNLPLDDAMRRWSGNGYGADVAPPSLRGKKIAQMSNSELEELIKSMRAQHQ